MNWSEKYRPTSINDLYLSYDNKNKILKWISDFKNKEKDFTNCLILHGPPGIGKTSLANIILESNDFDIIEFNSSDIRSQKTLREKIDKINGNINILNFMCNKKKKIGIIIDELDGLSSMEKGSVKELTGIITESKNFSSPFICTTNTINKKMDMLKKKSLYIKLNKPNKINIKKFIEKINLEEKLDLSDEIVNAIFKKSQLDFRRVVVLIEYLFRSKNNCSEEELLKLISNYEKKNVNSTTYESTDKLLCTTLEDVDELSNLDKSNIGYLFYENFINYVNHNRVGSEKEKLETIIDIYKSFCISDKYDKDIYINQYFSLDSYNDYVKFKIPNFLLNKLKKTSYNKYNKLNYSTLINKVSFEYINLKLVSSILDLNISKNYIYTCDYIFLGVIDKDDYISDIIQSKNIDKQFLEKICKLSSFFKKEDLKHLRKCISYFF